MRRRELELTLDLESDSEEDDLYDTVGQDVGDCSHIQAPSNVEKTSRIKEIFPMNVKEFYERYLSEKSDFWYRACKNCGCTDISSTNWKKTDCHQERTLEFKIPVKHLLGPRETAVTQKQSIHVKDNSTIEFHTTSISHDVMYSDSFEVSSNWRIFSEEQNGKVMCYVHITWHVDWKKSVFMVKSMIERNALEGAKEFFESSINLAKDLLRNESTIDEVRENDDEKPSASPPEKIQSPLDLTSDPEDQIGGFAISPPSAEKQLQMGQHPLVKPRKKKKVKKQSSRPIVTKPSPSPISAHLLQVIGLIFIAIFIVIIPFYFLIQSLPHRSPVIELRESLLENLNERISFVQSLLGQVSRNLTNIPGKTVKEQWERHWEFQGTTENEFDLFPIQASYFSQLLSFIGSLLSFSLTFIVLILTVAVIISIANSSFT